LGVLDVKRKQEENSIFPEDFRGSWAMGTGEVLRNVEMK